jgi:OFA family oxalate/formate antiporter-like MFS transporter
MSVFRGWRVVAGSAIGIGFSAQIFVAAGYTILAAGFAKEFGWQMGDLALGATLFLTGQVLGYPLAGYLTDRLGTLRVAVGGIVLLATHLFLLTRIDALWQLYCVTFTMGVCGPATFAVTYLRAISLWFSRRRGIALGLAASGIALGGSLIPLGLQHIIAVSGSSSALLTFAAIELFVVLPVVVMLVRDDPTRYGLFADGSPPSVVADSRAIRPLCGLTLGAALRTRDFWLLGVAFMIGGLSVYAIVTNTVHILEQVASLKPEQVAKVQAAGAATVLVGRITGGWLLDNFNARWVGFAMNFLIAASVVTFAMSDSIGLAFVAAILMGFAAGGENDVLPFVAARYFGILAFGKIYGVLGAMFGVGTALGPITFAGLVALTGSVSSALFVLAALTAAFSGNFLLAGRRTLYAPIPLPREQDHDE